MAAIQETHYRNVRVRRMEEDGTSAMVYPNTVAVSTVYDPKVNSPKINWIAIMASIKNGRV